VSVRLSGAPIPSSGYVRCVRPLTFRWDFSLSTLMQRGCPLTTGPVISFQSDKGNLSFLSTRCALTLGFADHHIKHREDCYDDISAGSRLAKLRSLQYFCCDRAAQAWAATEAQADQRETPDGLTISAQEWGNPSGPEILFNPSVSPELPVVDASGQTATSLENLHRDYDLRGHGNSDKPPDPARYRDSKAWATRSGGDGRAGLKRPVLVGWSYAGRVIPIMSPPMARAARRINFVDASIKADPAFVGDNLKNLPLMRRRISPQHRGAPRLRHGASPNSPPPTTSRSSLVNMMVPPRSSRPWRSSVDATR